MYVCMYVWYATVCYAMVSYDIVLVWHGVEAADQTQQLYLIVSTEMEAGVLLEAWLPRPASCWVSDPQLNLSGGFDCRSAVRAWYVQITISKFLSACVYTYMSICKCISIYLPIYRSIYSSIHLSVKLVRLCGPELENEATSCASIYNIYRVVWRPSDPYEGTMSSVAWLHYEQ